MHKRLNFAFVAYYTNFEKSYTQYAISSLKYWTCFGLDVNKVALARDFRRGLCYFVTSGTAFCDTS